MRQSIYFCLQLSLLLAIGFFVNSCAQSQNTPIAQSTSPSESAAVSESVSPETTAVPITPKTSVSPTNSAVISAEGIGPAQLGMTFADLKARLDTDVEFEVRSPFIVDFDAIAVSQAGEVQYYILYLQGQTFTDQDVIQGLFTDNPKLLTAQGVGSGTLIQQAIATYGAATLSYNTENESREYVRFADQPFANISFGTGSAPENAAGIYANPVNGYNETSEFKPDSTIKSVLVVCLSENCANQNQ